MKQFSWFLKNAKNSIRIFLPPGIGYRYYYMNVLDGSLIPNTKINTNGKRVLEINSLGCKGAEIDPSLPTVGIFGDSTTFGMGLDSWAQKIKLPGYQILNAGVEGMSMGPVVNKLNELAHRINLVGAVVYTGWHNCFWGPDTVIN